MNSLRLLAWLLPRRLRSSWQLLSVSAFGILAAATVLSVGMIYSQALSEGGFRHTLASSVQWVLNAQVLAQDRPLAPENYPKLRKHSGEHRQRPVGIPYGEHRAVRQCATSHARVDRATGAPT